MSSDEGECDVGEHCDVWGIGCLIYHMIAGVPIHDSHILIPSDEVQLWFHFWYLLADDRRKSRSAATYDMLLSSKVTQQKFVMR